MKPYVIQSAVLTDYEGETLEVPAIRMQDGSPVVVRRPRQFVEDSLIAYFNELFQGRRLFTDIKLQVREL
jgi:hypothetical protein